MVNLCGSYSGVGIQKEKCSLITGNYNKERAGVNTEESTLTMCSPIRKGGACNQRKQS